MIQVAVITPLASAVLLSTAGFPSSLDSLASLSQMGIFWMDEVIEAVMGHSLQSMLQWAIELATELLEVLRSQQIKLICVVFQFRIAYRSRALKSRHKTNELRAYIWLRASIYLVNSLVEKTDFRLIAAALKCAAKVLIGRKGLKHSM